MLCVFWASWKMCMLQWLMIFLQQISTVKEAFIDISLPIIEERVSCLNQMIPENKVYQADDCYIHWFLAKKIKVTARTLSWFFVHGKQISKPSNPGRLGKGSREMDTHASHGEVLPAPHSSNRNNKKLSGQVQALHTGHALFFSPFYFNLSQARNISEKSKCLLFYRSSRVSGLRALLKIGDWPAVQTGQKKR